MNDPTIREKRRILFVDDEPRVVDALQRYFRPLRATWEVMGATSARAALDIMETKSFDVVVSDMRMPEMDGATFLGIAKQKFPATMRIILSGQTDSQSGMRVVSVAHQFLGKPTDPALLLESIQRLNATHDAISDPAVRAAIGSVDALPSTQRLYGELNALLHDENASMDAIAHVIEAEPALVLKLLQLVNSAFFGVRRHIVEVSQAVSYLGIDIVRGLVLSVGIANSLPIRASRFDADDFHRHSLAVAQMCKYVDPNGQSVSVSFAAALLHDIGQLVLASTMPSEFDGIVERAHANGRTFDEEEAVSRSCNHTQIGAALLDMWGVPYQVVEALLTFEVAPKTTRTSLAPADVVYLSHRLVSKVGHELDTDEDRAYLARVGVSDRVEGWAARAAEIRGMA